jgi:hypothetical protein
MNFGQALASLLNGKSITRSGWSRPNMKLGLQPPTGRITQPFLFVEIANGDCQVWSPDQADLLSQDWQLVGAAAAGVEQRQSAHDTVPV